MDSRAAIASTLNMSMLVLKSYISDLSREELISRPGEGCNHVAWQLGHLIASQASLLNGIDPGAAPELPTGFAEKHGKDNAGNNNASDFYSSEEYLKYFESVNSAVINSLHKKSDADLDAPSPEHFRSMFPTVGDIYVLMATHPMMHAGQIVPIRRRLSKPIVI